MDTEISHKLENKRVLITAGPTWVPIDSVRVISNIATGRTGILLVEKLQDLGAKVTLILGPVETCCLNKKIKLIRFRFFDELKGIIVRELKSKKYDIVIHSAAVSDYRPVKVYAHKIKSAIKNLRLNLIQTQKLIDLIRKIDRSLFIVGFKFEPQATKTRLIDETRKLIQRANLNLAVANTTHKNRYSAYIVNSKHTYGPIFNKEYMIEKLIKIIGDKLSKS